MSCECKELTDNEIFAADADYDALMERLHEDERPLIIYLKHIARAHKEAVAEINKSDAYIEVTMCAVFAGLLATKVWETERDSFSRALFLVDRLNFFNESYRERIKSLRPS